MDLLAAIAAEPMFVPLWAVLAFAVGMYPVGMLFSCAPCCRCSTCTAGELPQTVTVTFDGFVDEEPVQGPYLTEIQATSCFGSGFYARVAQPSGDPDVDPGPITEIEIVSGGGGYAVLGRVEPTVTVGGGDGTGADFEVTLVQDEDACGIPFWKIDSVTIASGGDGGTDYTDGPLDATVESPGVQVTAAALQGVTEKLEPTLTPVVSGGSGADFTVTIDQDPGPHWTVTAVAVVDGGTGYADGDAMTFTLGVDDVEEEPASITVRTDRSAPTLELFGGTGTSAAFTVSVTSNGLSPEYWAISSVTIDDGGAGYQVGDTLSVNLGSGDVETAAASVTVSSVSGTGAITGVTITYGGLYWHETGVIESVEILDGGSYYSETGTISEIIVNDPGVYYEEDASEPAIVADVTLSIQQTPPSVGTGAALSATVDDDTASPTFGQITAVTIDDAGDGYLAWAWWTRYDGCCGGHYNNLSVVARRGLDGNNCEYVAYFCGPGAWYGRHGRVAVVYNGPDEVPTVGLSTEWNPNENPAVSCNRGFEGPDLIADCGEFEFVAVSPDGETATVAPGGDFEQASGNPDYQTDGFPSCHVCCRGTEPMPREITVDVVDNRPGGTMTGTYVLEAVLNFANSGAPNFFPPALHWQYENVFVVFESGTNHTREEYGNYGDFDPEGPQPPPCFLCEIRAVVDDFSSDYSAHVTSTICTPVGIEFELFPPLGGAAQITVTVTGG